MSAKSIWGAALAFVVALSLAMYAATYSPAYHYCKAPHADQPGKSEQPEAEKFIPKAGGTFFECEAFFADVNGAAITAIATVALGVITAGLVLLGWLQLSTTRAQLRAQVFPQNFMQWWEQSGAFYDWRFRPIWNNSGDTAAEEVRIWCDCEIRNSALPIGFDFEAALASQNPGEGLLPPKTALQGGLAPAPAHSPITPADIDDSQNGRRFIYLFGRVEYRDVFRGTPGHCTHFCWLILTTGDPWQFVPNDPNHTLNFNFVLHQEGNWAD